MRIGGVNVRWGGKGQGLKIKRRGDNGKISVTYCAVALLFASGVCLCVVSDRGL